MRYMLLIHEDPAKGPQNEAEGEALSKAYFAYTQELVDAGVIQGGDALESASTATTVRVRNGEALTTDGPYAETKELLGGYYIIDVPDLDAALKWAAKVPGATYGSIEVRPIREMG
jgi:hypothetical protein